MLGNKRQFLQVFEESRSLQEACVRCDIDRKQFYEWISEDIDFAKAVARSEIGALLALEDSLFLNSLKGNIAAMKLFFERRHEHVETKSYLEQQLEMIKNLHK